ncbi:MAG TPA: hypothetical protein VM734_03985 [Kofleriaceae bacterium]|jgi:hypothetical protein|nr:hypothetical protein [Kofleriaceae bacterium]
MTTSLPCAARMIAALAAAAGCAHQPPVPAARFANARPVTVVDDRRDVPTPPKVRPFYGSLEFFDAGFQDPLLRALAVPRPKRALGVNALDEVPDSTWFTNRIGVATLTPDEIRTGPLTIDSPEHHLPWTVESATTGTAGTNVGRKAGGSSPALVVVDARGVRFLLKFDQLRHPPEIETANHVVVNRLLWACGYNVPEDQVVYLRRDDLVIAPAAARAVSPGVIDEVLALVHRERDGRIRALASRWTDGKRLGGYPSEGVRKDDPNDVIPHERRRDLRGAYPIYAWLDHVDVHEDNFLDVWVADPGDARRHYVKHYAIDFGLTLGAMADLANDLRRGYVYQIDTPADVVQLFTLGIAPRPWERRRGPPDLRGVSPVFDDTSFVPDGWRPSIPYPPFVNADQVDMFWGAKLIARFTPDQIQAAVEAGRFSDPRAAAYVTQTLIGRQRITAAFWFARVNPLDRFEVAADTGALCFDDLAVHYRLLAPETATSTRYTVGRYDHGGRSLGAPVGLAGGKGRVCTAPIALAGARDGYTIVKLDTTRRGFTGTTYVHLARDPATGRARVIGVWRP